MQRNETPFSHALLPSCREIDFRARGWHGANDNFRE
jgi:hypothetical protein